MRFGWAHCGVHDHLSLYSRKHHSYKLFIEDVQVYYNGQSEQIRIQGFPMDLLLAIDAGTTSTRAMLFTLQGEVQAMAQQPITQFYPREGWVEHDPFDIWQKTLSCIKEVLAKAEAHSVLALGITNQRETTIIWDRKTGKAIAPAIVWQDRRTAALCAQLAQQGMETIVTRKTGLVLDPYFSATKINWLLENIPGARERAVKGELAFGTVDSYLLWHLTNGKTHATDATNASRTALFDIYRQEWDEELLTIFDVPKAILPQVLNSSDDFGVTAKEIIGKEIPIAAIAGDQQAATIGQACFKPGMAKSTYGTGCFVMLNTGEKAVNSTHRMLTTPAYRLNGKTTYALEGSIFVAGAAVQWLRDTLQLISSAKDTEKLALELIDNSGVYLVPAFTGLGAPYWDPQARGAIMGLTRDTGVAHIARAALESVCYQTKDLLNAMLSDIGQPLKSIRVDGGMAGNNWVMQFLSDMLAVTVQRPQVTETTALGVAYLAGLQVGAYQSLDEIEQLWQCEREFTPKMSLETRTRYYQGWLGAVGKVLSTSESARLKM
jgi:glycerol kinase